MNTLFARIKAAIYPTSVAEVVSGFDRQIKKLEQVRARHAEKAAQHQVLLQQVEQRKAAHEIEAQRASRVAEKFTALVGQ